MMRRKKQELIALRNVGHSILTRREVLNAPAFLDTISPGNAFATGKQRLVPYAGSIFSENVGDGTNDESCTVRRQGQDLRVKSRLLLWNELATPVSSQNGCAVCVFTRRGQARALSFFLSHEISEEDAREDQSSATPSSHQGEEDLDPIKIFQESWGVLTSSPLKQSYSESEEAVRDSGDGSALTKSDRLSDSVVARELVKVIRQNGWNSDTEREISSKVPECTPFIVCETLDILVDPDMSIRLFDWARQQAGYKHTTRSYNILIRNLAVATRVEDIQRILKEMNRDGCYPDDATFGTLITSYGNAKQPEKAYEIYKEMRQAGFMPSVITYSCVINVLVKLGCREKAMGIYDDMCKSGCCIDRTGYNVLMNLFGKAKNLDLVMHLYHEMVNCGFQPDAYTYSSLINSHLVAGKVLEAHNFFKELVNKGLSTCLATCNSLLQSLGKVGKVDTVLNVFQDFSKVGLEPDSVTYNIVINILRQAGQ
eukprot:c17236_g1_i1 orf=72-1520(+)